MNNGLLARRGWAFVALLLWSVGPTPARADEAITFRPDSSTKPQGPETAAGALIYLHGSRPGGPPASIAMDFDGARRSPETPVGPLPVGFTDFGRQMKLDTFMVVRSPAYDLSSNNDQIAIFITDQIERLASQGYRSVYLAGTSRGGWLAAEVATRSPRLAGVLITAPGDTDLSGSSLAAQRDKLAKLLAQTKVKRVFVAFFEDDPREAVPRADAAKAALERAGVSFFVLDRPAGMLGHSAIGYGRFVRRYRECLVEFFSSTAQASRGFDCTPGGPYASGADIKFPPYRPSMQVPSFAAEPLRRFVGRWEGDNEGGAYMILASTEIGEQVITLLTGYSPYPHPRASVPTWVRELKFTLEKDDVSIRHDFGDKNFVILKPVKDDELALLWQSPNLQSPFRMSLKRRPNDR
jgi:pimeloyl-ACP methyl ester carboxylesterase